jgi:hypothetical protein
VLQNNSPRIATKVYRLNLIKTCFSPQRKAINDVLQELSLAIKIKVMCGKTKNGRRIIA